jgi:hypothetical protein
LIVPAVILVASWLLCGYAASGPVEWQDSGAFLTDAAGPLFSAQLSPLSHPTFHFVSAVAFRLTGPSGVAYLNVALLVPLLFTVYRLSRVLGADRGGALLAASMVLLTHDVFWIATKVEVYLLHTLFVAAAYWIAFDDSLGLRASGRAAITGFITGLAAATHQLTFVVLLPLWIYAIVTRWRDLVWMVPAFALGWFPGYSAILNELSAGHSIIEVARGYLTGGGGVYAGGANWEGAVGRFDLMLADRSYVLLLLLSLAGVQVLGLLRPRPADRRRLALWAAAALNLLFAASYGVADRFTFFLPGSVCCGVLAMDRLAAVVRRGFVAQLAVGGALLAPPLVFCGVALAAGHGLIPVPRGAPPLPYRDDVRYFVAPYAGDRSATRFVSAYEAVVPVGAVVVADWTPFGALSSAQVDGRFVERTLVNCDGLAQWVGRRPVFLVRQDYCAATGYHLRHESIGFSVVP